MTAAPPTGRWSSAPSTAWSTAGRAGARVAMRARGRTAAPATRARQSSNGTSSRSTPGSGTRRSASTIVAPHPRPLSRLTRPRVGDRSRAPECLVKSSRASLAPRLLKGWPGGNSAMTIVQQLTPPLRAVPTRAPSAHAMGASLVLLLPDLQRRAARLALTPAGGRRSRAGHRRASAPLRRPVRPGLEPPRVGVPDPLQRLHHGLPPPPPREARPRAADDHPVSLDEPQPVCVARGAARSHAVDDPGAPARSRPGFRDVVSLIDLGQHTYREAADLLHVPLGTVMSRLHRGRRMLAERLALPVARVAAA